LRKSKEGTQWRPQKALSICVSLASQGSEFKRKFWDVFPQQIKKEQKKEFAINGKSEGEQ
jgi:hypothetical protein